MANIDGVAKMSKLACVLCNSSVDDALQFGEKITYEDTTAHLYCLLLTSNLMQRGDDNEGLYGFMPKDIKAEIRRTKKLFCFFCQEKGATIGCCIKSCRRSFHLPCALQNDCRFEFNDTFRSFCEVHHDIKKPKNVHKPSDLCTVCYDEMGEYNPIKSIPLPCCNTSAWCHKLCLQKYAQSSGYFLKCPLCKDSERFREWIACRGVFIPDRDAKWEVDETGPNSFYAFEQHTERPSECIAKLCLYSKGRKYQVDAENHKYTLIFCKCCGSNGVHLRCLNGKEFLCDDCETVWSRKHEVAATTSVATIATSTDDSDRDTFRTATSRISNGSREGQQNRRVRRSRVSQKAGRYTILSKELIDKYKLREFSIYLTRLSPKDFIFNPVQSDSEYETAKASTIHSSS